MSQHDFNIANQGFPATRADINNAFQAIATNSSGPTAPSTTYANQWWYDTTNNKMYLRNAADSAWIEVAVIDQTNNEWQITTGQITAADSDGFIIKTDDGTARFTMDDTGDVTFANDVTVTGSVSASNIPSVGALSNRNLLINSAMQVAQRGTSSTSGGYVSLDRWYVNQSGGSTTFSQETNANPSETGGLQKYARLNVSSSSDFTAVLQRIEDVTSVPSGTITISFYAKGTAPTGGLKVWCTQVFGSGGSSDVDIAEQVIAASLTSSWVRYTLNITVPSVDGKTIGAGSYFMVTIGQGTDTASTAYDLNITGVQLEVGDTATPFEHRSYGDELARCQRYYQKLGGSSYTRLFSGFCAATTEAPCTYVFPEMRAAPTAGSSGTFAVYHSAYTLSTTTSLGVSDQTTTSIAVSGNTSGLTVGRGALIITNNDSSARFTLDAEL